MKSAGQNDEAGRAKGFGAHSATTSGRRNRAYVVASSRLYRRPDSRSFIRETEADMLLLGFPAADVRAEVHRLEALHAKGAF